MKTSSRVIYSVFLLIVIFFVSCSLTVTRPVQQMSDTAAALKAAKEVNADTLSAETYRKAAEAYLRAQNEYKLKNFNIALEHALEAKNLAEEAEFEALQKGATRTSLISLEDPVPTPTIPYDYPTPTGTPAFMMDQNQGGGNSSGGQSQNNNPSP